MQRIKDNVFALVGTGMPRNNLGAAADDNLMNIAPDQNIAMGIGGRDGIINTPVADQGKGCALCAVDLASIIGNRRRCLAALAKT